MCVVLILKSGPMTAQEPMCVTACATTLKYKLELKFCGVSLQLKVCARPARCLPHNHAGCVQAHCLSVHHPSDPTKLITDDRVAGPTPNDTPAHPMTTRC